MRDRRDRSRYKTHSGDKEDKVIKNSFQVSDLGYRTVNLPFPVLGKIGGEGPLRVSFRLHR